MMNHSQAAAQRFAEAWAARQAAKQFADYVKAAEAASSSVEIEARKGLVIEGTARRLRNAA